MAKDKKKNSNVKDFNVKKSLKFFTNATIHMVNEALKDIDLDTLVTGIYFNSNDKDIKNLIKIYEKQLLLSKIDSEKFKNGLHDFFLETNKFLKENNLYYKFFELVNLVYVILYRKGVNEKILVAYHDLLIQQYSYFAGGTKNVVYGVKENGDLMYISEIGKFLTEINYEMNFCKNSDDLKKVFAKYGYRVKGEKDIREIIANDQIITNMLYQMAYYINEKNEYFLPKPFRQPVNLFKINPIFLYNKDVSFLKEKLMQRKKLLPIDGLVAKYGNMFEISEIFMKEEIINDHVVLLFKIKFTDNTYTSGFYDTFNKVLYDMWAESSHEEVTHLALQSLILQTYANFTCDFTEEEKQFIDLIETNDFSVSKIYPFVKYEVHELNQNNKESHGRNFNKNNYQSEFRHVQPFMRNLPIGATASDEAIELAKKMGIELEKGKTFVKDFRKKVYIK